ncbi:MAG: hypothetical protein IJZ89_07605 [Clostridia bacterium]|nr:hypothetical protein [Clostridia bacterium]
MSDDFEFIVPISETMLWIIFLTPIALALGFSYAAMEFINNYLPVIAVSIGIIIMVVSLFLTIKFKQILFILSGIIAASQLIFFLFYGFNQVQNMKSFGLWVVWQLIVFVLWVICDVVNLLVLGVAHFFAFWSCEDSPLIGVIIIGGAGIIGWIVNLIIFVLMPLIF